jgi:uncharacterized repeat protein (TIGR03943 family)
MSRCRLWESAPADEDMNEHSPHGEGGHTDAAGGRRWSAGVELAALVLLAAFLLVTTVIGRVRLFVAPAYGWLPPLAGVLLLAMALGRLGSLRREGGDCACGHRHGPRSGLGGVLYAIVLVIPVGLGLFVNPQQFSAEGVKKRRAPVVVRDVALERAMAWILGQAQAAAPDAGEVVLPEQPTVRDVLEMVEQGQGPALEGRFLTLVGQCSDAGDGRRLDLYRLLVTCCVADAQTISIEVVSGVPVPLDEGQWVRVGGVIRWAHPDHRGLPVLQAAKIEKISLPAQPYL